MFLYLQVSYFNVLQYNPKTNLWLELSLTGYPRIKSAICSSQGFLYAMGGKDKKKKYKSAMRFDTSTNSWSTIKDMHIQRLHAGKLIVKKTCIHFVWKFGT